MVSNKKDLLKKTNKKIKIVKEQSKVIKKDKKENVIIPKLKKLVKKTPEQAVAIQNTEILPKQTTKKVTEKKLTKLLKINKGSTNDNLTKPKQKPLIAKGKTQNKEPTPKDPNEHLSTLFVGNLPFQTKRNNIVKLFVKYGPIEKIRFTRANGQRIYKYQQRKQSGCINAYVLFKDAETANKALKLNGVMYKNNCLRITPSKLTAEHRDPKRTVFVGNLKYDCNENKLDNIFSSCGEIEFVRCVRGPKGCRGVAYVCFKKPESVGLALELNSTILDERPIHVERYSLHKVEESDKAKVEKAAVTGAKKRLENKDKKESNQKKAKTIKDDEIKKKKDFLGVKANSLNKKNKKVEKKNSKSNSNLKLAKKIAPKSQ